MVLDHEDITTFIEKWAQAYPIATRTLQQRLNLKALLVAIGDIAETVDPKMLANFRHEPICELLAGPQSRVRRAFDRLKSDATFQVAARRAFALFHSTLDSPCGDPEGLRRVRREALGELVQVVLKHVERLLECCGHAQSERDRRWLRRNVCGQEWLDLVGGEETTDPAEVAQGMEIADRVICALRGNINPRAFAALSLFITNPEIRTWSEAAVRAGASAATMSRAKSRCVQILNRELQDSPAGVVSACFRELQQRLADLT